MNFVNLKKQWNLSLENKNHKPALLAFDIGGTKISSAVIPVNKSGEVLEKIVFTEKVSTPKGVDPLIEAIKELAFVSMQKATSQGYKILPLLLIGSPGRFIGNNHEIIAPGSAANLESFSGEFDNLNLRKEFSKNFPSDVNIIIKNDAIAQFTAGLKKMLKDENMHKYLINNKIMYIGPGTGLGGGFCFVNQKGDINFYTDGHIYDIQIENNNGEIKGAEDLLSGRAFKEITGEDAKIINDHPQLFEKHKTEILNIAKYMAKIIYAIHEGNIKKTHPDADWPQNDINLVKGTKIYLIGGSIGTSEKLGAYLRENALSFLANMGIHDIKILPIPEAQNNALLGSAQFINASQIKSLL